MALNLLAVDQITAEDIARLAIHRAKKKLQTFVSWRSIARPQQLPPGGEWNVWVFRGGRGAGKTRAGAEYVLAHLRELGPQAWVGIGGPTIGAVREVCFEGPSGLIACGQGEFSLYNRSLLEARHNKGGYVKGYGSEEPDRWNGPQWTLLWADELALWKEESWHQARFGVRLGERPHIVATTTPKSRKFIKGLFAEPGVAITQGTMYDNPGVGESFRRAIEQRYGGTRLGRQEIEGQYIEDIEGALWQRAWIDDRRVYEYPPLARIVVAVDPAVTAHPESNETGIVVAGKAHDGRLYILYGQGYILSPQAWAEKAISLYDLHAADRIIAERNNGGDMVEATIRHVRQSVPVRTIVASRGKMVRAEPIAALYEQGRVSHVGIFPELEDQMASFPIANERDDMVDALVYALTELADMPTEFGYAAFEPDPFRYSRSPY